MDTTQDISKIDQLSQIFRYVTIERDENYVATEVKINESFLGFKEISDQSASGLEMQIIECIELKGLDLSKCRGQGYDGAANMSGLYSGVQARILKKEPNAEYIHCAAHNLNLTLNDSVKGIPEIRNFYDMVEKLYTFFGHSIKRWDMLSSFVPTSENNYKKTLKRLCPTRWSSRYESLYVLRYRYDIIYEVSYKISPLNKNSEERIQASGLKKYLEKFDFIFIVVLQTKIMEKVNAISKLHTDLAKAASLLCNAIEDLTIFRNEFDLAKIATIRLSEKWGVQIKFEEGRRRSKVILLSYVKIEDLQTQKHFSE